MDLTQYHYPPITDEQREFALAFTSVYGKVAKDITWMTATNDTVTVDLANLDENRSYTIQVYTADPRTSADYCYLLAEYGNIKGGTKSDFEFDYPTGLQTVYVSAVSSKGETYTVGMDVESDKQVMFDGRNIDKTFYYHEPMRYRIIYEGTIGDDDFDFDYNDLVIEVEYVRGQTSAVVKVLAVGCEWPVRLALRRSATLENGEDEDLFKEVHEALGFAGTYDYYSGLYTYLSLNTGRNYTSNVARTVVSLNSSDLNISITRFAYQFFTYFAEPADKSGKEDVIKPACIPQRPGSQSPQAILIADPTWEWVYETVKLSASYSLFRYWIDTPSEYPLWYVGTPWLRANDFNANN